MPIFDPSLYPNLQDDSSPLTFDLTIYNSIDPNHAGGSRNFVVTTGSLPVAGATNDCESSSSRPTSLMYTEAGNAINQLADIPVLIANETYEDQIGIYGALIMFCQAKQQRAQQFNDLWFSYHQNCRANGGYGWFGSCWWCCSNHPKDSEDVNTCKTGRNDLIAYATQANNILGLWDNFIDEGGGLLLTQETMLSNMTNYSLNQTMQAEFTALLAQVNEQIATSNLVIQQTELQLLQLKKDELKMKASYIVAPLLLIIGIALIFNKK